MSKKKRTSQQEKAEIRRQAFASAQGKVQKLKNENAYLLEQNNNLEQKNRELANENTRLFNKVVDLETKLSLLQETLKMSDKEIQDRAREAELYYRYSQLLTPLMGSIITKHTVEDVESQMENLQ